MSVLAFDSATPESPLGRSMSALAGKEVRTGQDALTGEVVFISSEVLKRWDVREEVIVSEESAGVFALARVVHRSVKIFENVESTRFLASRQEAMTNLARQVELLKGKRDSSSSNFVKLLRAFIYWVAWVVATGSFSGSIFDAAKELQSKVDHDQKHFTSTITSWGGAHYPRHAR